MDHDRAEVRLGTQGDATFVRDGLALFNVAVTGDACYSPLAIFLKDERGAVLGMFSLATERR